MKTSSIDTRVATTTPRHDHNKHKCDYCAMLIPMGAKRVWSWVHDTWVHWDCYVLKEQEQNEHQSTTNR